MKIPGANKIYVYEKEPYKGSDNKYHYLYKLEKISTGKFYIGVHSTRNLSDNYVGSGTILKNYITKETLEEFRFICLEFFSSRQDALQKEKEVVSDQFIKSANTYNLKTGGEGGASFESVKTSRKTFSNRYKTDPIFKQQILDRLSSIRMLGALALKAKIDSDPEYKKLHSENAKRSSKLGNEKLKQLFKDPNWSAEFSRKVSQPKDKHPFWDKVWIHNKSLKERRLVDKENINIWLINEWEKGRGPNIFK